MRARARGPGSLGRNAGVGKTSSIAIHQPARSRADRIALQVGQILLLGALPIALLVMMIVSTESICGQSC